MVLKNIITISSIVLNMFFIYSLIKTKSSFASFIGGYRSKVIDIYDINSLQPYLSKESVKTRFDKLYREYTSDIKSPDYMYYIEGTHKVDKWWYNSCVKRLRRILFLKIRLKDLENTVVLMEPYQKEAIYDMVREKRYDEILSDMSNYYSKFISTETYMHILQTSE